MADADPRVVAHFNAFQQHTRGRCPFIVYIEPIPPAVRCVIDHRLAAGISWWSVYAGGEVGHNFIDYQTGGALVRRSPELLTSRGPGGVPFEPRHPWEEVTPFANPTPLDAPAQWHSEFSRQARQMVKDAGLFFYSYLAFDAGRVDPVTYLEEFGDRWIPGLLSEEDHEMIAHLSARHAQKPLRDRDEAFALGMDFARAHFQNKRPYGLSGSSVHWFQAASFTGQQRWDHELANGNCQVQFAFLRGVAQQHGIPFIIYMAPWGYSPEGLFGMKADPHTPMGKVLNFAAYKAGKPDHLLEREWAVAWFSGPAAVVLESTQLYLFETTAKPDEYQPSVLGRLVAKLNHLAYESDFERGTPWRPACLLLDERHGWSLPCMPDARFDVPMMNRRKIWGCLDRQNADLMVDNFFGAIYPGYHLAGGFGHPAGELTATPFGESFDVLLSNANAQTLQQYPVVFLLGQPLPTADLRQRLQAYVQAGGTLVVNAAQVDYDWQELLGVTFSPRHNMTSTGLGVQRVADQSIWLEPAQVLDEHRYRYLRLAPAAATVLALTPQGDPLVLRHALGAGQVYLLTALHGQEHAGLHWPNGLLQVARQLIGRVLAPHQLVRVHTPGLQVMVNTTADGLALLLVNNAAQQWEGWLGLPGRAGALVRERYHDSPLHLQRTATELAVRLTLEPHGLRLLEVQNQTGGAAAASS